MPSSSSFSHADQASSSTGVARKSAQDLLHSQSSMMRTHSTTRAVTSQHFARNTRSWCGERCRNCRAVAKQGQGFPHLRVFAFCFVLPRFCMCWVLTFFCLGIFCILCSGIFLLLCPCFCSLGFLCSCFSIVLCLHFLLLHVVFVFAFACFTVVVFSCISFVVLL